VRIGRPKVALVFFRIESSEGDEVPGPNLVPGQNLGNDLVNTAAVEVRLYLPQDPADWEAQRRPRCDIKVKTVGIKS
jgi:hypothetical protein